jgi:hypothetical protein
LICTTKPHPALSKGEGSHKDKAEPKEALPKSALSCSVTTDSAKAQSLIEQGAAESFFFGNFLFCGKKESYIHRLNLNTERS